MIPKALYFYLRAHLTPFLGLTLILWAGGASPAHANHPRIPCLHLLQSSSPDDLIERVQELGPILAQIREILRNPPRVIDESPESFQAMQTTIGHLTHISTQVNQIIKRPSSGDLFPLAHSDRKRIQKLYKKLNDLISLLEAHQNKLVYEAGKYGAHLDLSYGFKLIWDIKASKILHF